MVGPPPGPPPPADPFIPAVSSRFVFPLGRRPVSLIQGYDGEIQTCPWFTMGGSFNPKEICRPVPRGPLLVSVDNQDGAVDLRFYLQEFATIDDLANAIGRDIQTNLNGWPIWAPTWWDVPANTKDSKVFTPQSDLLAVCVVMNQSYPAALSPSGIIQRGPSSIVLAATGPDISF